MSDSKDSKDQTKPTDLPDRRVKNYWAAVIATAGILIGIILIVRGDPSPNNLPNASHTEPQLGILVILASFVVAGIFYVLNNRHHLQTKEDNEESEEFN